MEIKALPDEIWMKILEMGINNSTLSHKELCYLSMSCKHLNNLTKDDTLWSILLARHFPFKHEIPYDLACGSSMKSLYGYRCFLRQERRHTIIEYCRKEYATVIDFCEYHPSNARYTQLYYFEYLSSLIMHFQGNYVVKILSKLVQGWLSMILHSISTANWEKTQFTVNFFLLD